MKLETTDASLQSDLWDFGARCPQCEERVGSIETALGLDHTLWPCGHTFAKIEVVTERAGDGTLKRISLRG
jgi:hypothetical protein